MSSEAGTTPTSEEPRPIDGAVLKVAAVVILGAIMSILDITVVHVALPTFESEFGASYATVAWSVTAYTLALATVIPLAGWAADRFGTKRLYILALTLFVLGSALCAAAWDITSLVGFRVIQGLGGGMLMPLGMTILTRAAGPDRIGRLMAIMGIPMLLGPISGPILGGWLIDSFTWHWIFLINVPIGALALLLAWRLLPRDEPSNREPFDFVGMMLLSPGLAAFLYGVSSIPGEGTVLAPKIVLTSSIGLLLIIAFVFHAFRPEHPLIDLRLFKNSRLTIAVLAMFMFAIAFFGAGLLFPAYFLQVRGETTLMTGLLIAPQGIGAMLTMPIAGTLADRIPVGRIVPFGIAGIAAGFVPFTQVTAETPYPVLLGSLFVMGLGMGATMMPLMTSALKTLKNEQVARGSTLVNIVQQVSASIGAALMSMLLTNAMTDSETAGAAIAATMDPSFAAEIPDPVISQGLADAAAAFGSTFWVSLGLVLVALVPALMLPRKREESALDAGTDPDQPPVLLH